MKNYLKSQVDAERLAAARKIRAARIPICIAEDDGTKHNDPVADLLVYQTGSMIESTLFDFWGGTGVVIQLVITINCPKFAITDFSLELPWRHAVRWLFYEKEELPNRARFTFPDGKTEERSWKAGDTMSIPPETHLPEDLGKRPPET